MGAGFGIGRKKSTKNVKEKAALKIDCPKLKGAVAPVAPTLTRAQLFKTVSIRHSLLAITFVYFFFVVMFLYLQFPSIKSV